MNSPRERPFKCAHSLHSVFTAHDAPLRRGVHGVLWESASAGKVCEITSYSL